VAKTINSDMLFFTALWDLKELELDELLGDRCLQKALFINSTTGNRIKLLVYCLDRMSLSTNFGHGAAPRVYLIKSLFSRR